MLLALLFACTGEPAAPPAATPVRVALNWFPEPEFGGFYDALLTGLYAREGLAVEIVPGGPGVPVLEMLAAGKVEVAVSGADDLLVRRAEGLDAVAVFPGFQDSPVGLMAHAALGLTRFEDVKGPVAIEAGSPFQQYLWATLGWEGKVAMVPTTGSIGPFAADPTLVQQAYVTSEPCVAEGQGLAVTFLPGRDAGWNPYASLVVVRGGDRDAAWVAAFTRATRAGWEHYLADPSVANAELVRLNRDLPADRVACIVARQRPFVTGTDGLGAMTEARWQAIAAALGRAGRPVDPAGAWAR